jgi:hypothetical protein
MPHHTTAQHRPHTSTDHITAQTIIDQHIVVIARLIFSRSAAEQATQHNTAQHGPARTSNQHGIIVAVTEVKETPDARKVADAKVRALAPAEKTKLVANDMYVPKLTQKEIISLVVTFYGAIEKLEKNKKDELVAQLRQTMEAIQGK